MGQVEPTYRIVEGDSEYGKYRVLTENKHQPLPDGVLRWYSNQHHVYASPDGYLVPINRVPDTRLQDIADAYSEWQEQIRTKGGRSVRAHRELTKLLDALIEVESECEHPVVRTDDYCESCDDYMGEGAWRKATGLDLEEDNDGT